MQDYQLKETCAVTLFGTVGAPLPYLLFTKRLQKSNRPLHSGILVVLLRFWLIPITILDQVAMTGKLSLSRRNSQHVFRESPAENQQYGGHGHNRSRRH